MVSTVFLFFGFFWKIKVSNGGKNIIHASDMAAEAGEHVCIFHFPTCDVSPPAVLLDGLVVFAAVSSRKQEAP